MNRLWTTFLAGTLLHGAACITVVSFGVLAPTEAHADENMEKAKKAFERGKNLYENGEYEKAAKSFQKAYQLSGRDELLYNIGQAYRKAEKLVKAESYFQKYLKAKPDAENSEQVVQKVVEIQEKLAARMASLKIETATEGRTISLAGEEKPRCTTPCSISVQPGKHELRVSAGKGRSITREVEVEEGASKKIRIDVPDEGEAGALHVRSNVGGGAVSVEGLGESSLPMSEPMKLPVGTYRIKVTDPSGNIWAGDVTIESGETSRLLVTTAPQGGGDSHVRQHLAFGLAGASIALISGGLLLGRNARQTHDILSSQQDSSGTVDPDLLSKGRHEQLSANILLGAGATTLLSGAGLLTWELLDSNDSEASASQSNVEGGLKETTAAARSQ